MSFTITLSTIALMLAYAVPGYLLIRSKLIRANAVPDFAVLLLYLCSPFQTLYAMQQIDLSIYMIKYLLITFFIGLLLMGGMLLIMYLLLRKKQDNVSFRICTVASAMGNCGFMGIPLMEALLPDYPQAVAFATAFFLAMNILMWTVASYIFTRDKRYISLKKVFFNPSVIAMGVALIFFFTRVHFTGQVADAISLLSKMCTPLCMLILGMRLALIPIKPMFTKPVQYVAIGLKLIVFPLLALGLCSLLPVEKNYVRAIYILCCVPAANVVLSFAEMLGEGQDTAANVVLLSTLLSAITMPLMLMLL